jgi:hypothetical protein
MATQLSATNSVLLPPTITAPIFSKATEQSAVQSLARRVPLSVTANTAIPIPMDVPVADWVSESGVKPAAQVGVGVKQMTGKKVALLVPVSEEVAMTNPGGLYDQLVQDLPTAIARAFDYAVINGLSLRTGGAGPFAEYLSQATNTVALGTTANSSGGLYVDVVTGAGKVVDKNYDFTGIAADPRLKIDAQLQIDSSGRPLYTDSMNTAGSSAGQIAGFPTFFNKGVSGKYWRAGDKVQTITLVGTPTGGTVRLFSGGNQADVAYNASTGTVQTAIRAWGGIYSTATVTGSAGAWVVTFTDIASNVTGGAAPFSTDQALLTGGTAAASKSTIVASGQGGVDSTLRGVGGDWSQAAYGVGMDISVRVSKEASYYDGSTWHSAFQENLVLLLVEAYYGFVMGSKDAFCTFTKGSAAF